ncbi:unnamed protein product [Eruca vesicaria subsp. sativa]|uniref:ADP-ribosyl cyclase/cyclic ADP-ribose hydrolase n=1 Tax=Eruca vesicaria subsp. sativa TaxID=29727 RepID=A0ABC8LAX6_ERUVS|nr:unnamed protein product [Eruca vesicaria subsp. sativa]
MAPSSSSPRNWRYNVFVSFHGQDARKSFLSHLRRQFNENGITMFDDQGIERGQTITPALKQAIRESRISIVVLTKNYASSSWCLDELLEILKCKEPAVGQIVMTVFYGVDPSHVRKQTEDFGKVFDETCARKTEEERREWSQALTVAGNIAGEDFINWDSEAKMMEKIARDVSNKLNATSSRELDDIVGLEAHLLEMLSLLDLDYDGVKMVAISGPAGIGKSTIARALHSLLSNGFQLSCFMDNLRESYPTGLDECGLKLRLQDQLLSKILNQDDIRIRHLGVIEERLRYKKVLIILDDVNNIKQLEALAKETTWFGPGSRVVVTTENKELLQQHGIENTYNVGFPYDEGALEILCRYAFRQSYPHIGFKKLAKRVTKLCGNLPLGLRVVGSSLRGKNEEEWGEIIRRLETILDHRDIEEVLRVGYESLHENEQSLFLHIAVFSNFKDGHLVEAMFADDNLDIKYGLKILANKSLIHVFDNEKIVMHKLLRQVGRQVIQREERWKRRILIDPQEICDVLEHAEGKTAVSGISFDISDIDELSINPMAFKRMRNLRYLSVYNSKNDGNSMIDIPEALEFPRRLRLLHWKEYPRKCLPPTFHPEYLVELNMKGSQLEHLWHGSQRMTNLKNMNMYGSLHLKDLPDLSHATNLERLDLTRCESLVALPSSIGNLHKLEKLLMHKCKSLESVPTNINLASLLDVDMGGCSRLRTFPDISTNMTSLDISETAVEEVPASISMWYYLWSLSIRGTGNLKTITQFHQSLYLLDLSYTDIDKIPECNNGLDGVEYLYLAGCRRLTSLPELPGSLISLLAENCESLETVSSPLNIPKAHLNFTNCFKLDQKTRGAIMQPRPFHYKLAILPGREIPAEFVHRGHETIGPFPASSRCQACLRISRNNHKHPIDDVNVQFSYRIIGESGYAITISNGVEAYPGESTGVQTEHLCIFQCDLPEDEYIRLKLGSEIWFEFINSPFESCEIIECGVRILMEDEEEMSSGRSNKCGLDQVSGRREVLEESDDDDSDHTTDGLFSCEFVSTILLNFSSGQDHEASFSFAQLLNLHKSI